MSYVDTMIDDMSLMHDAPCDSLKVIPNWGSGSDLPASYDRPTEWTAAYGIKWFHIMEDCPLSEVHDAQSARSWATPGPYTGNQSVNTRVQCRDLQIWFLLPNGVWWLHGHAPAPGRTMYPITWTELAGQLDNNTWRTESVANGGGASIKTLGYSTYEDYIWHSFTSPQPLPANYLAIATCFYGRLILDNESGTDDRGLAHILAAGSGDYYRDVGVLSSTKVTGVNTRPMGYGRLKYVTPNWQMFSFYSKTTIGTDELRLNPPPFIGLSIIEDQSGGGGGGGGGGGDPPVFVGRSEGVWAANLDGSYERWTPFDAVTTSVKVRRRVRAKYA